MNEERMKRYPFGLSFPPCECNSPIPSLDIVRGSVDREFKRAFFEDHCQVFSNLIETYLRFSSSNHEFASSFACLSVFLRPSLHIDHWERDGPFSPSSLSFLLFIPSLRVDSSLFPLLIYPLPFSNSVLLIPIPEYQQYLPLSLFLFLLLNLSHSFSPRLPPSNVHFSQLRVLFSLPLFSLLLPSPSSLRLRVRECFPFPHPFTLIPSSIYWNFSLLVNSTIDFCTAFFYRAVRDWRNVAWRLNPLWISSFFHPFSSFPLSFSPPFSFLISSLPILIEPLVLFTCLLHNLLYPDTSFLPVLSSLYSINFEPSLEPIELIFLFTCHSRVIARDWSLISPPLSLSLP